MGSNSFGKIFKITTWGESHGRAIGVVIDGCPAGIEITEEEINQELALRRPGKEFTSPRKEKDLAKIYSGVFKNKTTGAPISIIIENDPSSMTSYEDIKDIMRPGHSSFTYLNKYKTYDYRGGGRASGRETACRVAAGAIAKKFLKMHNISSKAFLVQLGDIKIKDLSLDFEELKTKTKQSSIFCPCKKTEKKMISKIQKTTNDSLGGVVQLITTNLPIGLGDPIYEKLNANLAKAMFSIGGVVGFEMGKGFEIVSLKGSENNDEFIYKDNNITLKTNNSAGVLAGISTGMPLNFKVAFKPTSSIKKPQNTVNLLGEKQLFTLPKEAKHDIAIAIRATIVVEAMCNIVLTDAILMNKTAILD